MYFKNGNLLYNGGWVEGRFNGKGLIYYINGNMCYNGTFSRNNLDGYGVFYLEDHSKKFIGYFINNKMINGNWYDEEDKKINVTDSQFKSCLEDYYNDN